ncbi:MAG: ATP synthase F1 subunit gamma [Phycisphaerales bacterium]|nr:MAG: ATP synthase F1 subunit gamma [Phycisphaerales bacterium]
MANRRVLIKRRKAVRNIRKITRTMQLIATARFQAAFTRAIATKPYSEKLAELVADLSKAAEGVDHPLMHAAEGIGRSAMVIITSNRGLCGGYNSNVLRTAVEHLDRAKETGLDTEVHMVGKKGISYFKFLGREMVERITHIDDAPKFEQIEPIANYLMGQFVRGEIASVHVAYMKFISTGRQQPEIMQLLPLAQDEQADADEASTGGGEAETQYEFSPEPKQLLEELLPATVRTQLFQCFTDATVSEQIARMVAMKAATDAAEDMITTLTRQYNRARQTQITMELLDIVGGANALT